MPKITQVFVGLFKYLFLTVTMLSTLVNTVTHVNAQFYWPIFISISLA